MLKYVIGKIVFDDPVRDVRINGSYEDWRDLPEDKSLFAQPPGQGMVIGNLTSQVFSNIYMDGVVRFIKHDLGYKNAGQYVDDLYIVAPESQLVQLKRDITAIATFLDGYGLKLNRKKTRIIPAWQGVPFLGMVVKNGAIMPDKRLTNNYRRSMEFMVAGHGSIESVASYLGMLCHYDGAKVSKSIFDKVGLVYNY